MRGIILDPAYRIGIQRLSQEQKGDLLDAIFDYNASGEIPTMDDMVGITFDMMRGFFDKQGESYREKCERNSQNANARWKKKTEENGTDKPKEEEKPKEEKPKEECEPMPSHIEDANDANETKPNEVKLKETKLNETKPNQNIESVVKNQQEGFDYIESHKQEISIAISEKTGVDLAKIEKELRKFHDYWTEKDSNGKMRWKKEKTFELDKRFKRWMDREDIKNVSLKPSGVGRI